MLVSEGETSSAALSLYEALYMLYTTYVGSGTSWKPGLFILVVYTVAAPVHVRLVSQEGRRAVGEGARDLF